MNDKKQIKIEIITYLCGDEDLSPKFINLLNAGNLTQKDGKIIRNKLINQLDSNYNFDLLFDEYYRDQLKSKEDYPVEEMKEYTISEEYLQLLDKHFPQTVSEACDILISMMDEDEIHQIKESEKFTFSISQHFGLGLFIRNHFGINLNQSRSLYSDILKKSNKMFFMNDDISDHLLDELWEEIQRRF